MDMRTFFCVSLADTEMVELEPLVAQTSEPPMSLLDQSVVLSVKRDRSVEQKLRYNQQEDVLENFALELLVLLRACRDNVWSWGRVRKFIQRYRVFFHLPSEFIEDSTKTENVGELQSLLKLAVVSLFKTLLTDWLELRTTSDSVSGFVARSLAQVYWLFVDAFGPECACDLPTLDFHWCPKDDSLGNAPDPVVPRKISSSPAEQCDHQSSNNDEKLTRNGKRHLLLRPKKRKRPRRGDFSMAFNVPKHFKPAYQRDVILVFHVTEANVKVIPRKSVPSVERTASIGGFGVMKQTDQSDLLRRAHGGPALISAVVL